MSQLYSDSSFENKKINYNIFSVESYEYITNFAENSNKRRNYSCGLMERQSLIEESL
jgi:hypothetical protein